MGGGGRDGARSWSVGELAATCGLSVRVLRHWDAMGLVSPARTGRDHRRYGPDDVTRLYRAMALRRAGLGLRRIATLLDEQDPDPSRTLREHLAEVERDLRRRTRLRDRLAAAVDSPDERRADHLMRVIETMTNFDQYVHGYHDQEGARLADQAEALVELLHHDTRYEAGERVLEIGCGTGAQTVILARHSPGAVLTSVDRSASSLTQAGRRLEAAGIDGVHLVTADVHDLPHAEGGLAAGAFDHVFVCFVLEHLADPVDALARLRRTVRPGGTVTVVEGDHGTVLMHPESEAAREAVACQVALQRGSGGDAMIGRRLHPLLVEAGWSDPAVSPRMVYVDGSRPELADAFIRRTFTAMVEGVREPALAAGLIEADRFDAGVRDLLRAAEPDGVFGYTFFKATATAD